MIDLFVEATHLYPGATGSIEAAKDNLADGGAATQVSVVFADGMTAGGELRSGGAWTLHVGPYRTAAGTAVAARSWTLELFDRPDRIRFRVVRRQPTDGSQTA